eukprot:g3568.t1
MDPSEIIDIGSLAENTRYEKIRDINQGSFGFVQLALDKHHNPPQQVAVKFVERGEKINKYVQSEILNHRMLLHPHIIEFKEVFLTRKHLCIAMEYAPGGDLFDYVVKRKGLKEEQTRWFFQQLIIAIDYCHRMGVANRDIKLENTLLDASPRPLVKICDFGYSKSEVWQSVAKTKVGTPTYFAPEVIADDIYNPKIADIWSCGVMLYVMMVGFYPFERPEEKNDKAKLQKMIQRILKVDYHVPSRINASADYLDLLSRILVRDPAKRITIEGIQNHKWYQRNLPSGVLEMNSTLFVPHDKLQSLEEIESIVEKATVRPADEEKDKITVDEYLETVLLSQNQDASHL